MLPAHGRRRAERISVLQNPPRSRLVAQCDLRGRGGAEPVLDRQWRAQPAREFEEADLGTGPSEHCGHLRTSVPRPCLSTSTSLWDAVATTLEANRMGTRHSRCRYPSRNTGT